MKAHVAQRLAYYASSACLSGAPPARPPGSWLAPIAVQTMPFTRQITVRAAQCTVRPAVAQLHLRAATGLRQVWLRMRLNARPALVPAGPACKRRAPRQGV